MLDGPEEVWGERDSCGGGGGGRQEEGGGKGRTLVKTVTL